MSTNARCTKIYIDPCFGTPKSQKVTVIWEIERSVFWTHGLVGSHPEHHEPKGAPKFSAPIPISGSHLSGASSYTTFRNVPKIYLPL